MLRCVEFPSGPANQQAKILANLVQTIIHDLIVFPQKIHIPLTTESDPTASKAKDSAPAGVVVVNGKCHDTGDCFVD